MPTPEDLCMGCMAERTGSPCSACGWVAGTPPESPAYDQPQPLSKQGVGYENCAQPQIWMAAVVVDPDTSLDAMDRSFPAFWLPFQDVNSHNHIAQWVKKVQSGLSIEELQSINA